LRRIRRAHFGARENGLAVFGLPLFAVLLVRSQRHHGAGGSVEWKGRTYPQAGAAETTGMAEAQRMESVR
jgi:hypothetical protein